MNDAAMELLFRAFGQMLDNQYKIMRHLGIAKTDNFGYDTEEDTLEVSRECFDFSRNYEHDN